MVAYTFPECPLKRCEEIIESKWSLRLMLVLLKGTHGFSEITKELDGISAKVLSERLKFFQERGLVTKRSYDTKPITTFYTLTPKGERFQKIIDAMVDFGMDLQFNPNI